MNKRVQFALAVIVVASVIGGVAAIYAALAHYEVASSEFCSISATFDCDLVNKSAYSEIFGIPVSILGFGAYVFFFLSSLWYLRKPSETLLNLMIFASVTGLLFSLYLTSIEAFVLHAWCVLCITSQISIIFVTASVFGIRFSEKKPEPTLKEIHQ